MKGYTDLKQSKKLAEFLPLESADMNWHELPSIELFARAFSYKRNNGATEGLFPCWSLAALLDVIPSATLDSSNDHYYRIHCMERCTEWYDNPIDACYEMILKLHELKLL